MPQRNTTTNGHSQPHFHTYDTGSSRTWRGETNHVHRLGPDGETGPPLTPVDHIPLHDDPAHGHTHHHDPADHHHDPADHRDTPYGTPDTPPPRTMYDHVRTTRAGVVTEDAFRTQAEERAIRGREMTHIWIDEITTAVTGVTVRGHTSDGRTVHGFDPDSPDRAIRAAEDTAREPWRVTRGDRLDAAFFAHNTLAASEAHDLMRHDPGEAAARFRASFQRPDTSNPAPYDHSYHQLRRDGWQDMTGFPERTDP